MNNNSSRPQLSIVQGGKATTKQVVPPEPVAPAPQVKFVTFFFAAWLEGEKIPGIPIVQDKLTAFAVGIDPNAKLAVSPPIAQFALTLDRMMSDEEISQFQAKIESLLDGRHIKYSRVTLVHIQPSEDDPSLATGGGDAT